MTRDSGRWRQPIPLILLVLLGFSLIASLWLGLHDRPLRSTPDSAGYLAVADQLRALDPSGLAGARAVAYPLVLALHKGLQLPYFLTVQLFNLLGAALLVWRLLAHRLTRPALATGLLATLLLWEDKQFGFTSLYLREGILIGITGLHLALLVEAFYSRRKLNLRLALVALALLIGFHFKGLYLYPFALAAPWLLWGLLVRHHNSQGRAAAMALLGTVLLIPLVALSNPHNDQNLKGMSLIGMLVNSPIPASMADALPDRPQAAARFRYMVEYRQQQYQQGLPRYSHVDPFTMDRDYRKRFGEPLASHGVALYLTVLRHAPLRMIRYLWRRAVALLKIEFIATRDGMCLRIWGTPGGLPSSLCRPLSVGVVGLWMALPIMLLISLWRQRGLTRESAVVVALGGMSSGLVVLVTAVGYTDYGRLFEAGFLYAVLSLPWLLALWWQSLRPPVAAA